MALPDEEDLFELSEQMGEAEEEGGLTDVAALRERLFKREEESAAEAAKQRQVLEQIQQAKLKLLEAPDRRQALMGLAQKLSTPRERDDPRFYERQNLYTFLRDVGEYGQEQKAAERKRQEDIAALNEKYATEALKAAETGQTRAQQLAAQYLREPRTAAAARDTRTTDEKNAAAMGITLKEYLDYKAGLTKKPDKTGPEGEAAQILWATTTLDSPTATSAEKDAAQRILAKKEPRDIRSERVKTEKYADTYLGRVKEQNQFTIPDIQSAIDQIDEGGVFVAGNIARIIRGVPVIGQAATDLEKTMESIQAKVGFDKMLQLKETSPTGSTGLGAVSNAEQRLLQAVKGSLDKDQSPKNLRKNLVRLKDFYEREVFELLDREAGIKGLTGIDETLSTISQGGAKPAAGGAAAPMIDPEALRKERERRKALKKAGGG